MRRQDEIVSLFSAADAAFRRLLLDLAGDLSPAFDGEVVASLIRSSLQSTDPTIAALALSARRTFEPALAASIQRIAAPVAGTWSALHRAPSAPGALLDATPDEAEQARQATLHRALLFALEPLRRALCTSVASPAADPHHTLVLACLAEMPAPEAVDALAADLAGPHAPAVAVALAIAGTAAGREAVLAMLARDPLTPAVAALRHLTGPTVAPGGAGATGKFATLTGTSRATGKSAALDGGSASAGSADARVAPALVAAARSGSLDVAVAAATALAGHPELVAEVGPLLLARRDPWVTAHLLVALARAKAGLSLVLVIAQRSRVGLLRALAVRAAGALGGPQAHAFVLDEALKGQGPSQALALELAARDPADVDTPTLVELSKNPHWRVRLNAALALAARDPQTAFPPLMALLGSELEIERAGGVFALAYLSGDSAERVLFHLAGDASPKVREAAVASLSRHQTPRAHHALLKIALAEDTALGRRALQALAWASGEGAAAVLSKLLESRSHGSDFAWRGQLYRTAGALAAGLMLKPTQLAAGLESPAPEEVAGCLDGLMLADIPPAAAPSPSTAVTPAATDVRVRSRAALRAVTAGSLAEAESIASLTIDSDPAHRSPALDATLELLALAPWLGRTPRCDALQKELAKSLRDPRYQRFATRRLELSQLRASLPVPTEADADVSPTQARELPPQAVAIVDLPRPRPRADTSSPGYYPPPSSRRPAPWWRPVAQAAAALTAFIAAAALWSYTRPPPSAASLLAPAPQQPSAAPVLLGVTDSPGATSMGEGETIRAKTGQRVAVAGPYPGPRVQLEGGALKLSRARSRPDNRLGCDLTFQLDGGTADVDARPGGTRIEIDAAGQKVSGTGARFRLTVSPTGGRIAVRDGTVELAAPISRTVPAGTEFTWGVPPG